MSDSDPRTADAASPGDPTPTYLIGYDGSPASHAAIELAQRLAQIVGARVVAANVYGAIPVSFAPYGSARLYGRRRPPCATRPKPCSTASARQPSSGAPSARRPSRKGCTSSPRDEGAALIAIGLTRKVGVRALMPGSLGERVLQSAPFAVAVAPADFDAAQPIKLIAVAYDGRDQARHALETARILAQCLSAQHLLIGATEPAPITCRRSPSATAAPPIAPVPSISTRVRSAMRPRSSTPRAGCRSPLAARGGDQNRAPSTTPWIVPATLGWSDSCAHS